MDLSLQLSGWEAPETDDIGIFVMKLEHGNKVPVEDIEFLNGAMSLAVAKFSNGNIAESKPYGTTIKLDPRCEIEALYIAYEKKGYGVEVKVKPIHQSGKATDSPDMCIASARKTWIEPIGQDIQSRSGRIATMLIDYFRNSINANLSVMYTQ